MSSTSSSLTTPDTWVIDPRGAQLSSALQAHARTLDHVLWVEQLHSTNDHAKTYLAAAKHQHVLVISNQQSAGRGQAGRIWQSPQGNLYLSLLTTLQHPVSGRLALEVAIALLNTPMLSNIDSLSIKWPNDLYHHQAKWGGILIESVAHQQVVIGVGINLQPMQDQVQDQAVTDLGSITSQPIDQLELALQTTLALLHACEQFDHGSMQLATRFAAFDNLLQKAVVVHQAGQADIQGIAMGICPDGALVIQQANQQQKIIYSGQVRQLKPQ
jgi:BirA family biotin operon repressor/biotin-[acetyl-CoA-carboxylase] ligase